MNRVLWIVSLSGWASLFGLVYVVYRALSRPVLD
jgi:hypothetical protein